MISHPSHIDIKDVLAFGIPSVTVYFKNGQWCSLDDKFCIEKPEILGHGSYAEVYKYKDSETGEDKAIKMMNKTNDNGELQAKGDGFKLADENAKVSDAEFLNELYIWAMLTSKCKGTTPEIVLLEKVVIFKSHTVDRYLSLGAVMKCMTTYIDRIVEAIQRLETEMEYRDIIRGDCDMYRYILVARKQLIIQIMTAFKFVKDNNVVHRDAHDKNILVYLDPCGDQERFMRVLDNILKRVKVGIRDIEHFLIMCSELTASLVDWGHAFINTEIDIQEVPSLRSKLVRGKVEFTRYRKYIDAHDIYSWKPKNDNEHARERIERIWDLGNSYRPIYDMQSDGFKKNDLLLRATNITELIDEIRYEKGYVGSDIEYITNTFRRIIKSDNPQDLAKRSMSAILACHLFMDVISINPRMTIYVARLHLLIFVDDFKIFDFGDIIKMLELIDID